MNWGESQEFPNDCRCHHHPEFMRRAPDFRMPSQELAGRMNYCPTCRRPFARPVDVGGIKRQAMYDFIAAHPDGVTNKQIMDHVYQLEANGGPDNTNVVSVTVSAINKILAGQKRDIRIRSRGGPGAIYKLVLK